MSTAEKPWVHDLTIGEVLRTTARKFPARPAYWFPQFDWRRTFAQLDADVDRVARSLLALDLCKGDKVAVWATNWPQWMLLQFATARIGAILVTINPAYRSNELAYVLKQSDCTALFLIDKFKSANYFEIVLEQVPELSQASPASNCRVSSSAYPLLRHVVTMTEDAPPGMLDWLKFMYLGEKVPVDVLAERERQLVPHDPINIQYTSGTTGFPKGAMLTHHNILMNGYYVADAQKLTEHDCVCVPVPFYHCFGCVLGVLGSVTHGSSVVVPREFFQAEPTLMAIEAARATSLYGVPTMFISVLDDPKFKPSRTVSLRTGIMAGSPCPIEIMRRVVDEMGADELTIAYGLTEFSPVITQTRTEDPLELRVKTVGRPLPGVEVKLVDPHSGAEVTGDQQGELCARGHGVMVGYYNMPEQTAEAIDSAGWLHSGDLATRLENGYYRITGRMKDMVIRGGENIYPREVEEFLYTIPAIQDVAVVGVPDVKFIEELVAWIVLKPGCALTEGEIRAFCDGRLARYKIPRYIKFVDSFPQTVTGKIQKFKIREIMIRELGLEHVEGRETA